MQKLSAIAFSFLFAGYAAAAPMKPNLHIAIPDGEYLKYTDTIGGKNHAEW